MTRNEYSPEDETFEDPVPRVVRETMPNPTEVVRKVAQSTIMTRQIYDLAQILTNNDTINFMEHVTMSPVKAMDHLLHVARDVMSKLSAYENDTRK